jgi:hypothetical protein
LCARAAGACSQKVEDFLDKNMRFKICPELFEEWKFVEELWRPNIILLFLPRPASAGRGFFAFLPCGMQHKNK